MAESWIGIKFPLFFLIIIIVIIAAITAKPAKPAKQQTAIKAIVNVGMLSLDDSTLFSLGIFCSLVGIGGIFGAGSAF